MGIAAATIGTFALSALATAGIVPAELWGPVSIAAAVASVVLLVVFFQPWLVLGVVVDLALLWAVLVAGWSPHAGPISWSIGPKTARR